MEANIDINAEETDQHPEPPDFPENYFVGWDCDGDDFYPLIFETLAGAVSDELQTFGVYKFVGTVTAKRIVTAKIIETVGNVGQLE